MTEVNNQYLAFSSGDMVKAIIFVSVAVVFLIVVIGFTIYDYKERNSILPDVFFLYVGISFVFLSFIIARDVAEKKEYGDARTQYAVYLDGDEVEYDKVCLENYTIDFNDEKQEIYLSSK